MENTSRINPNISILEIPELQAFCQNGIAALSSSAAERPDGLNQANSLASGSHQGRLRPQPRPRSQEFAYDLSALVQLPNEMQCAIFKRLDQKDLESFFKAIEQHVLLAMAQLPMHGKPQEINNPLVQLLESALRNFCKPVNCNLNIYKMLQCAKRLGMHSLFECSPELNVDFSSDGLHRPYLDFKTVLEGMTCGFKELRLINLNEEDLMFSGQAFPRLDTIRIQDAHQLKTLKLEGNSIQLEADSSYDQLHAIYLLGSTKIDTIDIEAACHVGTLVIQDASAIATLNISQDTLIHHCEINQRYHFTRSSLENGQKRLFLKLENFASDAVVSQLHRWVVLSPFLQNSPQSIMSAMHRFLTSNSDMKRLMQLLAISSNDFMSAFYTDKYTSIATTQYEMASNSIHAMSDQPESIISRLS